MIQAQTKTTLLYIGDPMCSWCYGFSPELDQAVKELEGIADFQLVMGGLRPYNTETMSELGDFLKEHWEHVENASQQKFNYQVLKENWAYDTEPPSRARFGCSRISTRKRICFF